MPTLENGYEVDIVKKRLSRKKRRCYMHKQLKQPRTELEVLDKISDWCADRHPRVEIQKSKYEKLVEKTGEKKIIDATLIGKYKGKSKSGATECLIAELEFEEHQSKKNYIILKDMTKITVPLRKLYYWRNDIPQYWIKIDKDGTPFMINYRHINDNCNNLDKMPRQGIWQNNDQITRIVPAERKSKKDKWPKHVIIGWEKIFKELHRVIRLARF
jgi:hypothetical protein